MSLEFYDYLEIRKLRKASGLTQQDLATALKKDRVTIARFETGVVASLDLLIEYATFFNRDYRDFLLPVSENTSKNFLVSV